MTVDGLFELKNEELISVDARQKTSNEAGTEGCKKTSYTNHHYESGILATIMLPGSPLTPMASRGSIVPTCWAPLQRVAVSDANS